MKKKATPNLRILLGMAVVAVAVVVVLALSNRSNPAALSGQESVYIALPKGITEKGLHYLGSPDAPITMMIYEDIGCHNCRDFFINTEPFVVEDYIKTGQLKIVVQTIAFVNNQSLPAAEGLFCAADQGAFWEYRDVLFRNQGVVSFTRANLLDFANQVGIDGKTFSDCYDRAVYDQKIQTQTEQAFSFGVTGTPTFEINGVRYVGARSYLTTQPGEPGVKDLIEEAIGSN